MPGTKVGGLGSVQSGPSSEIAAKVKQIEGELKEHVQKHLALSSSVSSLSLVAVRSQVVAGMMHYCKLKAVHGGKEHFVHCKLFQPLPGSPKASGPRLEIHGMDNAKHTESTPIEYF